MSLLITTRHFAEIQARQKNFKLLSLDCYDLLVTPDTTDMRQFDVLLDPQKCKTYDSNELLCNEDKKKKDAIKYARDGDLTGLARILQESALRKYLQHCVAPRFKLLLESPDLPFFIFYTLEPAAFSNQHTRPLLLNGIVAQIRKMRPNETVRLLLHRSDWDNNDNIRPPANYFTHEDGDSYFRQVIRLLEKGNPDDAWKNALRLDIGKRLLDIRELSMWGIDCEDSLNELRDKLGTDAPALPKAPQDIRQWIETNTDL